MERDLVSHAVCVVVVIAGGPSQYICDCKFTSEHILTLYWVFACVGHASVEMEHLTTLHDFGAQEGESRTS